MTHKHGASKLTVKADAISIEGKNGRSLARINLQFCVGTSAYNVIKLEKKGKGFLGRTGDPKVVVEILANPGGVSVELKGAFSDTGSIIYFGGSSVSSLYGRAFVPDADCRLFETAGKEDFYLTNSGMLLQKKVSKKDLWMIAPPPHVLSFGDNELGWFGLSIPEPMPVVCTQISCHRQMFHVTFDSYSPSHSGGRLPRVFIDVGLEDDKAILDRHCVHAHGLGLIDQDKKSYEWWHNPVYCTWGDQCYLQKTAPRKLEDSIAIPLDEARIMHWAEGIRSIYPGEVNYIIDAGWFDYLGDYDPKLSEFKTIRDFKGVLSRLKARGFRAILWYTPFWVQTQSRVEKEHPDYLLRCRDGRIYRDQDNRAFLDYSNPDVREYTRGRVEYLLKTLDADGFKIDMNYVHPFMSDVVLHDSSWGYGNQFWLQVMKFFHACATAVKEDAFFTISGIESYLQPYASSVRLNDLFDFHNAKAWYDRAEMVARLMPDVPIDVDGWPASLEKIREYQFVSPVFGAPVTYYIDAVEVMTAKLTDVEHNRMASVWHVYGKVPCGRGMKLTIDSEQGIFERRGADGRLKAIALQKSAFVCFTADRIYLTSNCDRAVSIPVESVELYRKAEKVYRDGRRETVNLFKDGRKNLVLNVCDSGSGILCYEIS
ncbi:MAG TPA: hypothetical protein DET40_00630 [Lentisphaeria bacterium]|nr:hypothetical protein [Lentisphaeria bacterium]